MRSALVLWLERMGLPGWLAPDYAMMVGLAALLGAAITMRLSERDRADTRIERRALLATYVGALAGGYVFEWLRALPAVLASQSFAPLLHSGRAAYGGFLFGTLAAFVILRRGGAPVRPFLDRMVPLSGISFGFVRFGCFLAGCDYGLPTASGLGVRFPAGSPAAVEHAALGWVSRGGESLPVHATQLYEAAVGLLAAGLGSIWLTKGKRDGRAFATFVVVYAIGRFFVEMLRGDGSRGMYGPLSTAQWVSMALVVAVSMIVWQAKRKAQRTLVAVAAGATLCGFSAVAMAQPQAQPSATVSPEVPPPPPSAQPVPPPPPVTPNPSAQQPYPYPPPPATPYPYPQQPYPQQPYPYPYPPPAGAQPQPYPQQPYPYPYPYPQQPYPYPYPPPAGAAAPQPQPQQPPAEKSPGEVVEPEQPKTDSQADGNKRRLSIGLGFGGYLTPKFGVSNGTVTQLEATFRFAIGHRARMEVGLEGKFVASDDAVQGGVGVPMRFVSGTGRNLEMDVTIVPFYSRIGFDSKYFQSINGFGARFEWGIGFPVSPFFALGLSPVVVGFMSSSDVDLVVTYEPKVWLKAIPF